MSLASLDRLAACHEALIHALDGNDLGALDEACRGLAGAVAAARAEQDLGSSPELKERLLNLSALAHAAQVRVNFLTDRIRRRIDAVAAMRGEPAMTYQPAHR